MTDEERAIAFAATLEERAIAIAATLLKLTKEVSEVAEEVDDQLHAFDQRLSAMETAVFRTEALAIKLLESVRRAAARAKQSPSF
jgi:hypothetical protein